jgi:hypothetical protein
LIHSFLRLKDEAVVLDAHMDNTAEQLKKRFPRYLYINVLCKKKPLRRAAVLNREGKENEARGGKGEAARAAAPT